MSNCRMCGEPMPDGEEMFFYHGYSGPCPKPPLPKNEYEPWKELGISELDYWKKRYLEMSQQSDALRAELEQIKASSVEVEYIDSGTFQGGEEDCFVKGLKQAKACFVYSPDAKPFKDEEDPEGDGCPND